jgi:hypothetical protein
MYSSVSETGAITASGLWKEEGEEREFRSREIARALEGRRGLY